MAFDWKRTLGTVAPALAAAFGTPMAGVATKILCDAFGLNAGATEEEIGAAITGGNTDALIRLKEIDKQFAKDMKSLDVDLARLETEDRASARALGIAKGTETQALLSVAFIAGFFAVFGVFINAIMAGVEMPQEFVTLVSALIGIMAAAVNQIMNYWFGTNASSARKTDLLAKAGPIQG